MNYPADAEDADGASETVGVGKLPVGEGVGVALGAGEVAEGDGVPLGPDEVGDGAGVALGEEKQANETVTGYAQAKWARESGRCGAWQGRPKMPVADRRGRHRENVPACPCEPLRRGGARQERFSRAGGCLAARSLTP